jgi:hypothetical protein
MICHRMGFTAESSQVLVLQRICATKAIGRHAQKVLLVSCRPDLTGVIMNAASKFINGLDESVYEK